MKKHKQPELFAEYEILEEGDAEKSENSSGLSIIPYLAVEEGHRGNDHKKVKYRDLSPKERAYVRESENQVEIERWKLKAARFEKRNGYPFSWHLHELREILYRERGEVSFYLEVSPHSFIIKRKDFLPPVRNGKAIKRESVTQYSMKSRKRFFEKMLTIDWDKIPSDNIRELTLTYPSIYPKDGQVLKSHLNAYAKRIKRFCRDYGDVTFIWKMEFQRRGAPHFHLMIITRKPIPLEKFRSWGLKSWNDLVGKWILAEDGYSGDEKKQAIEKHAKAGIEADKVKKSTKGLVNYMVWYISKGSYKGLAKDYQHEVPKEYQNSGRWWGIYGKKSGVVDFIKKTIRITEEDYEIYKNRIIRTLQADGKKYKYRESQRISLYSL